MSEVEFEVSKLSSVGRLCLKILIKFKLVYYKEFIKDETK